MKRAGHSQAFRELVTKKAVSKYRADLTRWEEEGRTLYRTEKEREDQIKDKGGKSTKTSWFGELGYNTTLTLPATMGSALLDKIKNTMAIVPSPKNYKTLL